MIESEPNEQPVIRSKSKRKLWQIRNFLISAKTRQEAIKIYDDIPCDVVEPSHPISIMGDDGKLYQVKAADLADDHEGIVAMFHGVNGFNRTAWKIE